MPTGAAGDERPMTERTTTAHLGEGYAEMLAEAEL
jgi:hypothetical protein